MIKNFSIEKISIKPLAIGAIVFFLTTVIVYFTMVNNIFVPDDPAYVSDEIHSAKDPRITLDSSDVPYISWNQGNPEETVYIRKDGNKWVDAPGEIVPDPNGNGVFHLLRTENKNSNISYDYKNHKLETQFEKDGKTQHLFINTNQDFIITEAIAVDSNENPHVVWIESLTKNLDIIKLIYIKWDGNDWVYGDGQKFDPENKKYLIDTIMTRHGNLEIIIDPTDKPHIVYDGNYRDQDSEYDYESYNSIYYLRWNGQDWVTADGKSIENGIDKGSLIINDTGIEQVDFALDSSNFPHIVWGSWVYNKDPIYEIGFGSRIKYVFWNGKNWVTAKGKGY